MEKDGQIQRERAPQTYDVVIVGAGAAGLMCALTAGGRGRRVLLLEGADKVGKKILISGGGRCNFTNLDVNPDNYQSANTHFCKSALNRFTPQDFIDLVEKHGIAYHEKTLGQLFCDDRSSQVVSLLLEECRINQVTIKTGCRIQKAEQRDGFWIRTGGGTYQTGSLVVATGGLSIPKMGATSFGYELARQFGLEVVACKPALVPFTFSPMDLERYGDLSGLSAQVEVRTGKTAFREAMLFTHKGLSGPAILQISSYWKPDSAITVDLLPDLDLHDALPQWKAERPGAELKTLIAEHLPARLVQRLLDLNQLNCPVRQVNQRHLESVSRLFHQWEILPDGTEGYRKAEVTQGGVDTNELSSKTFESRKVPGLYFIGEVVDVTGWLGGFNFQWAWASGYCAGLFV